MFRGDAWPADYDVSLLLQAPKGVDYYRKPFEFLSLGIMAYVGNDKALTQVRTDMKGWSLQLFGWMVCWHIGHTLNCQGICLALGSSCHVY